jgi:hypothetical protein
MGRTVTKRKDGHFGVSGTPEGVYYGNERTAKRIAAQLDKADAEQKSGKPAAPPKNQNQKAQPKTATTQPAAAAETDDDDVDGGQ